MEQPGAAAESGPRDPEDIALVVVLPLVALDGAEHAAAAERIAQKVDIAARSTGILEVRRVGIGTQFGRDGRDIGVAVETFDQRFEPPGGRRDVGIQHHVILGLHLFQSPVVASGEAVVTVELQHLDRGKLLPQHRRRAVGRTVVGHHDARIRRCSSHDARQVVPQIGDAVPVEYDDLDKRHGLPLVFPALVRPHPKFGPLADHGFQTPHVSLRNLVLGDRLDAVVKQFERHAVTPAPEPLHPHEIDG